MVHAPDEDKRLEKAASFSPDEKLTFTAKAADTDKENKMKLCDRRIVVSGATSGIGLEIARLFAIEGARIAVFSRELERAQQVVLDLPQPQSHLAVEADVGDEQQVDAGVRDAAQQLGGIDGLVHSAGVDFIGSLESTTTSQWDAIMTANLRSTFLLNRAALAHLRIAGSGTIVNLASALGLLPLPARSAYCAAKAGIIMFSKALAAEVADDAIRVNALCPGAIDTPMLRAGTGGAVGHPLPQFLTSRFAMKRVGKAQEVAQAALFLTSADASFITGTALAIDGGRSFH